MSTSTPLETNIEQTNHAPHLKPIDPSPQLAHARPARVYRDPHTLTPDEENALFHDYFDNALDILVVASNANLRLFDLIDWLDSPPIAARLARLRQAALERVERVAAHRAVAAINIIADLAWTRAESDRAIETKRKAAALVIRTARGLHPAKRTSQPPHQPPSPQQTHPAPSDGPPSAASPNQPPSQPPSHRPTHPPTHPKAPPSSPSPADSQHASPDPASRAQRTLDPASHKARSLERPIKHRQITPPKDAHIQPDPFVATVQLQPTPAPTQTRSQTHPDPHAHTITNHVHPPPNPPDLRR